MAAAKELAANYLTSPELARHVVTVTAVSVGFVFICRMLWLLSPRPGCSQQGCVEKCGMAVGQPSHDESCSLTCDHDVKTFADIQVANLRKEWSAQSQGMAPCPLEIPKQHVYALPPQGKRCLSR